MAENATPESAETSDSVRVRMMERLNEFHRAALQDASAVVERLKNSVLSLADANEHDTPSPARHLSPPAADTPPPGRPRDESTAVSPYGEMTPERARNFVRPSSGGKARPASAAAARPSAAELVRSRMMTASPQSPAAKRRSLDGGKAIAGDGGDVTRGAEPEEGISPEELKKTVVALRAALRELRQEHRVTEDELVRLKVKDLFEVRMHRLQISPATKDADLHKMEAGLEEAMARWQGAMQRTSSAEKEELLKKITKLQTRARRMKLERAELESVLAVLRSELKAERNATGKNAVAELTDARHKLLSQKHALMERLRVSEEGQAVLMQRLEKQERDAKLMRQQHFAHIRDLQIRLDKCSKEKERVDAESVLVKAANALMEEREKDAHRRVRDLEAAGDALRRENANLLADNTRLREQGFRPPIRMSPGPVRPSVARFVRFGEGDPQGDAEPMSPSSPHSDGVVLRVAVDTPTSIEHRALIAAASGAVRIDSDEVTRRPQAPNTSSPMPGKTPPPPTGKPNPVPYPSNYPPAPAPRPFRHDVSPAPPSPVPQNNTSVSDTPPRGPPPPSNSFVVSDGSGAEDQPSPAAAPSRPGARGPLAPGTPDHVFGSFEFSDEDASGATPGASAELPARGKPANKGGSSTSPPAAAPPNRGASKAAMEQRFNVSGSDQETAPSPAPRAAPAAAAKASAKATPPAGERTFNLSDDEEGGANVSRSGRGRGTLTKQGSNSPANRSMSASNPAAAKATPGPFAPGTTFGSPARAQQASGTPAADPRTFNLSEDDQPSPPPAKPASAKSTPSAKASPSPAAAPKGGGGAPGARTFNLSEDDNDGENVPPVPNKAGAAKASPGTGRAAPVMVKRGDSFVAMKGGPWPTSDDESRGKQSPPAGTARSPSSTNVTASKAAASALGVAARSGSSGTIAGAPAARVPSVTVEPTASPPGAAPAPPARKLSEPQFTVSDDDSADPASQSQSMTMSPTNSASGGKLGRTGRRRHSGNRISTGGVRPKGTWVDPDPKADAGAAAGGQQSAGGERRPAGPPLKSAGRLGSFTGRYALESFGASESSTEGRIVSTKSVPSQGESRKSSSKGATLGQVGSDSDDNLGLPATPNFGISSDSDH